MATRKIKNTTLTDIYLQDFGNQKIASLSIVSLKNKEKKISNSIQLFDLVASGDIVVLNSSNTDITIPANAWKYLLNAKEKLPVSDIGSKLWVHSSPKPQLDKQLYSYWTGAGDDTVNNIIGDGESLTLSSVIGTLDLVKDIKFDHTQGQIYIHEAYISWMDCGMNDCISGLVVASPTLLQTSINLDYELVGNKVKFATGGVGTGTHGFTASPTLVQNKTNTGYWNYDTTNGLTPNLTLTGIYDIYDIEIEVNKFINKIPVMGTSNTFFKLTSSDSSLLPPGYFLRIKLKNGSNTLWHLHLIISMFRENTI